MNIGTLLVLFDCFYAELRARKLMFRYLDLYMNDNYKSGKVLFCKLFRYVVWLCLKNERISVLPL